MKVFENQNVNLQDTATYLPIFFRLMDEKSILHLQNFVKNTPGITIIDELEGQLRELVKSLHPAIKIKAEDYPALIQDHLNGREMEHYGVWVYYPWSNRLIHLLDEEEFVEVRTNRNRYKITRDEQRILKNQKIGVVGLSVGQSIALTLAMERVCGELRLADFDLAELSNLNRIRTGVHNLGVKKTVIAAREIAEIDPFIKVKLFDDGLTKENIDEFFVDEDGKIDLLVEVCDGLDVKIVSRFKAKSLQVPVIMDTNDRGMLDIERYDLEPNRPILHGLADGLDPEGIRDLTNEQKVPYILRMIGGEDLSTRLKASMIEVEQSINTWPQLASSVTLGGALTTDVARRILLNQLHVSGRYYVDLDELIKDEPPVTKEVETGSHNKYKPLKLEDISEIAANYFAKHQASFGAFLVDENPIDESTLQALMHAATMAPSAGNNQPWKWVAIKNHFFLFHDKHRSYSWGDFDEIGSHGSLGAAIENVSLKALNLGFDSQVQLYPEKDNPFFTAIISFKPIQAAGQQAAAQQSAAQQSTAQSNELLLDLSNYLDQRITNRRLGERKALPTSFYEGLQAIVETIPGAAIQIIENEPLDELGEVLSGCDRERLLYKLGHEEFFHEIRWTPEQAAQTGDGIDLNLVDLTNSEKAGFKVATDWEAIAWLEKWDKGRAFQKMSKKSIASASSMVLFTMPSYNKEQFVQGGRAVLRAWLYANKMGVSVHPMLSPVFFFNRLKYGADHEMTPRMKDELYRLRAKYEQIFDLSDQRAEVFLMKLAIAEPPVGKTHRLPTEQIFTLKN